MPEKPDKQDALDDDGEEDVYRVETVPPPESGDAYSAPTVIKEAPQAVLNAIRKTQENKAAAARAAAARGDADAKPDAASEAKPEAKPAKPPAPPLAPRPPRVPTFDREDAPSSSASAASAKANDHARVDAADASPPTSGEVPSKAADAPPASSPAASPPAAAEPAGDEAGASPAATTAEAADRADPEIFLVSEDPLTTQALESPLVAPRISRERIAILVLSGVVAALLLYVLLLGRC